MTATLKVKHLVLLVGTLLGIFLLLQCWIVPKVQMANVKKDFAGGAPNGKAAMKRAIDHASRWEKLSLIRKHVIENGTDFDLSRFDVVVGAGFYYMGGVPTLPDAPPWSEMEKVGFLKEYVAEGPVDGYLARAAEQLAFIYEKMGRDDDALAALELGESRLEDDASGGNQAGLMKLNRAKIHARNEEYANATKLLDELMASAGGYRDSYTETEVERMRARILSAAGGEGASVSGVAKRSDGSPLVGIGVYLRQSNAINHSLLNDEPYQTLTDAQGRYSFRGVVPGSYQLAIGVSYEQIDGWTYPAMYNDWLDIRGGQELEQNVTLQPLIGIRSPANDQVITGRTVKFEWDPVEGAAYYALHGTFPFGSGGYSNPRIASHIKGSEAEISLEQLYESSGGISYQSVDGKNVPDPTGLLGFGNPDGRFSWYVEAYDGNDRLISRSNGYRLDGKTMGPLPFFYLKARTLTEADRLLLEGKLNEAMAAYKKDYETDPGDRYSLHMIIRLYETESSINRAGKWPEDAMTYAEKMMKADDSGKYAFMLFMHNIETENWKNVDKYYDIYRQSESWQADEGYAKSIYAKAYLKQGKIKEASELFAQALKTDPSHRFVGYSIALDLIFSGTFDSAIAMAEKYPERDYFESDKANWAKMAKALKDEEAAEGSRYRDELREALKLAFAGDEDQVDAWAKSASHPAMKAFMQAVANIW
ncbi:hypothetical protein ACFPPD_07110 [Cohnella suwonensis]|uniref:Carboxypeptidase regulatory-like domain-containing protein n=1 Tax=Cohnella suwonensis TaxID=696072 RepID=A0ABW0LRU9_9BACL